MGSACDMFYYNSANSNCQFAPHNPMKEQNLFDIIQESSTDSNDDIHVLQCSTPYENILQNNDPFTQSLEGWEIDNNCTNYYISDNKYQSMTPASVNGMYQFRHYSECDTGNLNKKHSKLFLSQGIGILSPLSSNLSPLSL